MKKWYFHLHTNTSSRGFTLVEMIIAVAIFSVVMLIAVGSLVSIIDANRKAHTQKTVLNNLTATLETISRNIREGSNFTIVAPDHFTFVDRDGRFVQYRLIGTSVGRSIDNSAFSSITAPDVFIEQLQFEWIMSSDLSNPVRKVLITARGSVGPSFDRASSEFNLQSLVSQRFRPSIGGGPGVISETEPDLVCPFEPAPGRVVVNLAEVKVFASILRQCPTVPSTSLGCQTEITFDLDPSEVVPPGTYDVKLASYDDHCGDGFYDPGPGTPHLRFPRAPDKSHPIDNTTAFLGNINPFPAFTVDGLFHYHEDNEPDSFVQNDPSEPGGLSFECHDVPDDCSEGYCQAHEQFYIEAYDTDVSVLSPLFTSGITRDVPFNINIPLPPDDVGTVTIDPGEKINRVKALHAFPLIDSEPGSLNSGVNSVMPNCIAFDAIGGVTPTDVEITPF